MPKKKHPTEQEKKKLNNDDVPLLPLERAHREFRKGNVEAADEAWNFVKHGARKPKKKK